ncbi:ATP-dependent nuclease [Micromonospora tulbaghiae]|uniref:ATP-dependent endonuclease of the OLD family n=1 Tax=Micromonospora tulbaghiae TaxID=479978 RepID=A0ABY0KQQ0_9ACTN|nr:AAA family ATPase [Micromonospora tulbaghiae]SCF01111.1 putative ATP-dependent endonuclease of the OLD family [Micromonospora tulbaghiae]
MKVSRIMCRNFRGVREGTVLFDGNSLLVGGNSVGKSTICDALDLVLGPERLARRPIIEEHDFHCGRYLLEDGSTPEIRIEVILTDLSEEATRRFRSHLRVWSPTSRQLLDLVVPGALSPASDIPAGIDHGAQSDAQRPDVGEWCLPVVFLGRFDPEEDDFVGATYFAYPETVPDDFSDFADDLGKGLRPFKRDDKRLCGFLYLRANRTGSRALSFQRGSLLDTIVRLEAQGAEASLWERALRDVAEVVVTDSTSGFSKIRTEVRELIGQFVTLTDHGSAVDVHVSDLTREHLRDVLKLFVSPQPGTYAVPFNRLSTGSLNLLVFALLTYIAKLKGDQSVIFAMEEPEIALPPHAQRRLVRFALEQMDQVIVTSHSPYVIEMFEPDHVVAVSRDDAGDLSGSPIALPPDYKIKKYKGKQREFAEAVLARAVCVVEGATEAVAFRVAADVLEQDKSAGYQHPDLVGLTFFDAGNDVSVPLYAPVFSAMGKPVFGIHDTPTKPLSPDQQAKTSQFTLYQQISYAGVEALLVAEIPVQVQRRFCLNVATRSDYPSECGTLASDANDDDVRQLTLSLLKKRKGALDGYASLLIGECGTRAELPHSFVDFLVKINQALEGSSGEDTTEESDGQAHGS